MTYTRTPFPSDQRDDRRREEVPDGSQEIAISKWMFDRLVQVNPEVRPNLRYTIRSIVGDEFTEQELSILEDRAIKAADVLDVPVLKGLQRGAPVFLNPRQKKSIDRIVNGLGEDALGSRARDAYGKAIHDGQIRVR